MLVRRPQPRCLAALSFIGTSSARPTSTSSATGSTSQSADKSEDSIFTAPESPWDHVFSDIEPAPIPSQRRRTHLSNAAPATVSSASPFSRRKNGPIRHTNLVQRASGVRQQRASLTAREMSVFDEMFDIIFNAVSAQDGKASSSASSALGTGSMRVPTPSATSSFSGQTPSIGRAGAPLNDLFRTLRRRTSRVRWTTAIDEELDRKKETMELFNTDHDLLHWVINQVFGEVHEWDEEAKGAMAGATTATAGAQGEKATDAAARSSSSLGSPKEGSGKQSLYPHLIAHAMKIFRTTYSNPSLSLAIFNHAARVSIPSYVFGCTAPAYNEMIEARWEGWGDLEGVCNALEEMRANGVNMDRRTRMIVEKVRRDVGAARPVEEAAGEDGRANLDGVKDVNPLAGRVWQQLGEAEVMRLVHRIERLALRDRSRMSTSSSHEELWKSAVLQPGEDDGWNFDGWDYERKTEDTKNRRWKARPAYRDEMRSRTLDDWSVLPSLEKETESR